MENQMKNQMMTYSINPIAFIHSPYKEKFTVPRQSGLNKVQSEIVFQFNNEEEKLRLRGLENFSHLWVTFIFHLIDEQKANEHNLTRPPRLGGNEKMGIYATRSPHRPNRIGLSLVKIHQINDHSISIIGGDFVDGTPVIDIKPYIPEYESIPHAKSGWLNNIESEHSLNEEYQVDFSLLPTNTLKNEEQETICEILKRDPRPSFKRKSVENDEEILGVYLLDYNVSFKIDSVQKKVFILEIKANTP